MHMACRLCRVLMPHLSSCIKCAGFIASLMKLCHMCRRPCKRFSVTATGRAVCRDCYQHGHCGLEPTKQVAITTLVPCSSLSQGWTSMHSRQAKPVLFGTLVVCMLN